MPPIRLFLDLNVPGEEEFEDTKGVIRIRKSKEVTPEICRVH